VYFVPNENAAGYDGLVARYDTHGTFSSPAAWSTFDTTLVGTNAKSFIGAVFDGQYLYFAPNGFGSTGTVARFRATSTASMPKLPAFFGSFY